MRLFNTLTDDRRHLLHNCLCTAWFVRLMQVYRRISDGIPRSKATPPASSLSCPWGLIHPLGARHDCRRSHHGYTSPSREVLCALVTLKDAPTLIWPPVREHAGNTILRGHRTATKTFPRCSCRPIAGHDWTGH